MTVAMAWCQLRPFSTVSVLSAEPTWIASFLVPSMTQGKGGCSIDWRLHHDPGSPMHHLGRPGGHSAEHQEDQEVSCKACELAQDVRGEMPLLVKTCYVRVGNANVELVGCEVHLAMLVNSLRGGDDEPKKATSA